MQIIYYHFQINFSFEMTKVLLSPIAFGHGKRDMQFYVPLLRISVKVVNNIFDCRPKQM